MVKGLRFICDFFVIVVQVSFSISIIPYVLFGRVDPFSLALLIHAIITFFLLLIRFHGRIASIKKIFAFPPIVFLILLLFLQLASGIINLDSSSFGISIILLFDLFVFSLYLNNLFGSILRKRHDFSKAFFKTNSFYVTFAFFNVAIVLLSALLQLTGMLTPFSNNIDNLFTQLLISNTTTGTHYFMPGWLSIQTMNSRLGILLGTLTGWTHEPHVFGYLVFPSLFFILGRLSNKKILASFIIISFAIAGIFSFSVTTFLVVTIIVVVKMLADRRYIIMLAILMIFLGLVIFNYEIGIIKTITDYSLMKVTSNTSSMDYSANHIEDILLPNSILGDGVLLIGSATHKNGGLFTSIFYVLFYASLLIETFKLIFSRKRESVYVGLAFLYFALHSFKLSSSVFAMPYTFYFLIMMALYKKYSRIQDGNALVTNNL